ncbi:MAG: M56 family metallopeptidase [Oscillospiraceae bacterium]|nr:M56 family metallopeptidase [Oscillospiraceae bacterium]
MKEILLTSSALIFALLILRKLFRNSVSRRIQYALWGLVLLRLLIPINLPAVDFNVLTATQPVQERLSAQLEAHPLRIQLGKNTSTVGTTPITPPDEELHTTNYDPLSVAQQTDTSPKDRLTTIQLLCWIWWIGSLSMAIWMMLSNLRFWKVLRKNRIPCPVAGNKRRIWLVPKGLPSPCLFGLFHPAIYLTPAALSNETGLRHILAHEETHARHLDPLWALLRSMCLIIYWFDPLVWWAAIASKVDCELACDEGALHLLGEQERIPYGRTLLSLIPVRQAPISPILSVTTMSADKRQLKERITCIAEHRRTTVTALLAVVLITGLVCAATFTDASASGQDRTQKHQTQNRIQSYPLTGAELTYFNEDFFGPSDNQINIRCQFLSSTYETPEEINLFELFYCGVPDGVLDRRSDVEMLMSAWHEELAPQYGEPDCPIYALSTADMDGLLSRYTGLTLAQTNKVGLGQFIYLPSQDAYYWYHGDTNYHVCSFTAGLREKDLIRLYYYDTFYGGGWKCLTLRETGEQSYHFVSHLPCKKPTIPTVYPEWEPDLTLPLNQLEPYQAPALQVEHHSNDMAEYLDNLMANDSDMVTIYHSTDGKIYAAVSNPGRTELDCFLTLKDDRYAVGFFQNLFGYNGIVISYDDYITGSPSQGGYVGTYYDYYTVTDGTPSLLLRAYGVEEPIILDLDGDGTNELAAATGVTAQIFFQRDGQIYEANLVSLLKDAWPELTYWDYSRWDANYRHLYASGFVQHSLGDSSAIFWRYLYFDGENVLVYKDNRTTVDHVLEGIDLPETVLTAIKNYVLEQYNGPSTEFRMMEDEPTSYDDWRITSVSEPYETIAGSMIVEIWRVNYELHTTTPDRIFMAGGRYMTEDSWVSPGYPDCDYFYFQKDGDGSRTYLFHDISNDCVPGTGLFLENLTNRLYELGLLPDET